MQHEILSLLEEITPFGFVLTTDEKGYAKYQRDCGFKVDVIGLGNILDGELNDRLDSWISFSAIESILRPAFKVDRNTDFNVTIASKQNDYLRNLSLNESIYSNLPLTIDSDAALERARVLIQQFIEQDALPFFRYWSDIRRFLPYLETVPFTELYAVFYNDAFLKKVAVWHLCNHPRLNEFIEERLNAISDAIEVDPKNSRAKEYLKILRTIIKRLEKVKPLYEWDSSWLEQR